MKMFSLKSRFTYFKLFLSTIVFCVFYVICVLDIQCCVIYVIQNVIFVS